MADLLALQPNMDIKLHIVAPEAKRDKVFQEIRRPVKRLPELAKSRTTISALFVDGSGRVEEVLGELKCR